MVFMQKAFGAALTVLEEVQLKTSPTDFAWRRVLLLGEAYVRLLTPQRAREAEEQERAQRVMATFPGALTAAMQHSSLPARQRLEAGILLADLDLDPPGLDDFVPVGDGSFAIGRYPVTNRQYRRFIDAGGYAPENEDKWWSQEGRDWKRKTGQSEPYYWDNTRFNRPTQPVVTVTWYEANAYCAWLTSVLQSVGQQVEARLPTAAEWQQAAGPDRYPWGERFDAANANTEESNLNQTTPVHMYPAGASPTGVWDLAGNVWEWTSTDDGDSKNPFYYICGGSWYEGKEHVGSAARYSHAPYFRLDPSGFRVVVVPFSR